MAISHADHNHPNTPAARAACRKRIGNGQSPLDASAERALGTVKVSAERALAESAGLVKPVRVAESPAMVQYLRHWALGEPVTKTPSTGVVRSAFRKGYVVDNPNGSGEPMVTDLGKSVAGLVKPAKVTVVPRKRGDGGVVKGMKAAAPKNTKRANSLIKNESDMADVPHALAHGIREAWARDLDVRVGDRFRDDEARIVIQNEVGEIALVWKVTNPHGVHAIFVRNFDSSRTFKVNSVRQAFEVTETWDAWDVHGNLVGL